MSSMPKKLTKTVTKRLVRKWLRRLSVRTQVIILIVFGFIMGVIVEYIFVKCFTSLLSAPPTPPPSFPTVRIAANDRYNNVHALSYAFFFGTGRSGTQHLSRVLVSRESPISYVTHEEEHVDVRTKQVVLREYRPLASLPNEAHFNTSVEAYVKRTKIPFYKQLMYKHRARRLLYTGHVPMAFGLGPALVKNLPPGSVRIVRVRRERLATAASLMALGPEEEDPWGSSSNATVANSTTLPDATLNMRWFPRPTDAFVRLQVSTGVWASLNRFQRWLWYVDDVECRWQALVYGLGDRFSWMEESLESLTVMDGGRTWSRIAEFVGVDIDWRKVGVRDNSIQYKQRTKISVAEEQLREWDMQYRKLVGRCKISSSLSYGWSDFALGKL
ncbi:hypothetical protein BWQ96_08577 [Gracilariopsis chorda]|uniref:Uncharacterized protein n=1 Tax=Gracilariopsis chorda TaxID=448386 RepID=A0A2V3IHZ6_9FLOR|nr:hypothetical protein BWQ96_08577 [Gracilariopsis chorda]|eukprot:PXF41692.1 hypothetical protein BWQ96_08577 [Gracilariopsis chorda]